MTVVTSVRGGYGIVDDAKEKRVGKKSASHQS